MFSSFDFRTMLLMSAILSGAISLLLVAIGSRLRHFKGLNLWVLGHLLVGTAVVTFTLFLIPLYWRALLGGLLMVYGLMLCWIALLAFDETPFRRDWVKQGALAILLLNLAISVLPNKLYVSVMVNTMLCVLFSLCSALFLLKYSRAKKSYEHIFTGFFFLIFVGFTLFRLFILGFNQLNPIDALTSWKLNQFSYLVCVLCILAVDFGFVSMVHEKLTKQLSYAASHDWLTGLMNRRSFEASVSKVEQRGGYDGNGSAMLIMDLDKFKRINDRYGHLFGDQVIKVFAEIARDHIRKIDALGRYGGEEFCIVMPSTDEAGALLTAERIRSVFEQTGIPVNEMIINCTVSVGVCDSLQVGSDFRAMFSAADKALYVAKKEGRNKVVAYSTLTPAQKGEPQDLLPSQHVA